MRYTDSFTCPKCSNKWDFEYDLDEEGGMDCECPICGEMTECTSTHNCGPEYRFVLVDNSDGNGFCNLQTEFVPDDDECDHLPDVWSSDEAAHEALRILGYSIKVVKK